MGSIGARSQQLLELTLLGLELAEQPVAGLEQMAEVRRASRVRIAADEDIVTTRDARRAYELRACELANAKLAKVGGIAASVAAAPSLLRDSQRA